MYYNFRHIKENTLFNFLKEESFHNVYGIINRKTGQQLSDIFEMHFIELNKFNKEYKDLKTALDRWTVFLNRAYESECCKYCFVTFTFNLLGKFTYICNLRLFINYIYSLTF